MSSTLSESAIAYIANIRGVGPMQTVAERDAASHLVELLGIRSHHDHQKNWDTFKCLAHILAEGNRDARVLDAGSGAKAVMPRWLHQFGYRNLYACDVLPCRTELLEPLGIRFTQQDLTATNYEDQFFDAVTSISVIEHNVPLERFLNEMRRILKPSGLLLISTDYWSEPINCSRIYPYGEAAGEMKIFDAAAMKDFVDLATAQGFEPCSTPTYATTERAVRWERVDRDYTFYFIALRKR